MYVLVIQAVDPDVPVQVDAGQGVDECGQGDAGKGVLPIRIRQKTQLQRAGIQPAAELAPLQAAQLDLPLETAAGHPDIQVVDGQ